MNVTLEETTNSIELSGFATDVELNNMHEHLYSGMWGKVGYFFMVFINHIVGPILLLGIIIFETFGGDPQKRNVINRLVSLCCANLILASTLLGVCRVWRELFGLIDVQIMTWIDWVDQICLVGVTLFVNEMTILRYLYIVVWKRVRGLDDRFWTLFLSILTYSWAFCLAIINKHFSEVSLLPLRLNTANLNQDFPKIR